MSVVFITGASRGIGAHLAAGLAGDGHHVIAASRSGDRPDAAGPELEIMSVVADVCDERSVNQAVERAVERFGGIDVVIANAGVGWFAPLEIMPPEAFALTIDTNLLGAVRLIRAAAPHLRSSGRGRVIAISSLAANSGLPGEAAYCASKAGLEAALESLRYEFLPFGVHVSVIQPGYTDGAGLVVSGRVPGTATDSVYAPLLEANDAGHDEIRRTAEGPDLILDAVREIVTADAPQFRWPLGEFGAGALELRHLPDDEVLAALTELFGLQEWMAQRSAAQS